MLQKYVPASLKRKIQKARLRNTAVILCYHGVHDGGIPFPIWTQIDKKLFESHLDLLKSHYDCISLGELTDQINKRRIIGNPVVVTFDDGYSSNYHVAYPLLKRYSIPATIFSTAGLTETSRFTWSDQVAAMLAISDQESVRLGDDSLPLSNAHGKATAYRKIVDFLKPKNPDEIEDWLARLRDALGCGPAEDWPEAVRACFSHLRWHEIADMLSSGLITIGAHGMNHWILSRLHREQASKEITDAKTLIEARIGRPVVEFSYPNGTDADFGPEHRTILKETGFRAVVTTSPRRTTPTADPWQLPRVCIGNECSPESLDYILTH